MNLSRWCRVFIHNTNRCLSFLILMASIGMAFPVSALTIPWVKEGKAISESQAAEWARAFTVTILVDRINVFVKADRQRASGSGFIIGMEDGKNGQDSKVWILTNKHVIDREFFHAAKVSVLFNAPQGDRKRSALKGNQDVLATLDFASNRFDAAILTCSLNSLPPETKAYLKVAPLPTRELLEVALKQSTDVYAYGSPRGEQNIASSGSLSRAFEIPQLPQVSSFKPLLEGPVPFIGQSAPLNPGNSGGPLLSLQQGVVIGINTAIPRQGQLQINYTTSVWHVLDEYLKVKAGQVAQNLKRAPFGIMAMPLDVFMAREDELDALRSAVQDEDQLPRGDNILMIALAFPTVDLMAGDVLLSVNGVVVDGTVDKETGGFSQLTWLFDQSPGNSAKVRVFRRGKGIVETDVFLVPMGDRSFDEKIDYLYIDGYVFRNVKSTIPGQESEGVFVSHGLKRPSLPILSSGNSQLVAVEGANGDWTEVKTVDDLAVAIKSAKERGLPYIKTRSLVGGPIQVAETPDYAVLATIKLGYLDISSDDWFSSKDRSIGDLRSATTFSPLAAKPGPTLRGDTDGEDSDDADK